MATTLFRTPVALLSITALLIGCGAASGRTRGPRVSSPFTEDDSRFFENGVSFVTAPESLGGEWEGEWEELLEGRVQRADAIVILTPHTFREDQSPRREVTYRVSGEVTRQLLGDMPVEFTFVSRTEDPGYASVRGHQPRILEHEFIAFIKWRETSEEMGSVVEAAWHLEPAAPGVLQRTETLLERLRGVSDSTRTVHYN